MPSAGRGMSNEEEPAAAGLFDGLDDIACERDVAEINARGGDASTRAMDEDDDLELERARLRVSRADEPSPSRLLAGDAVDVVMTYEEMEEEEEEEEEEVR